ncbi:MAG: Pr6Pr family membrane protein [Bacteroidetes bacterium]|nr:Pr6Pr family membrane protein [Bacteroidota bacterium]
MNNTRKFALAAAIAGWFALLLQCILILQNRQASLAETLIRYFSFFTILSNIFITVSFSMIAKKDIAKEKDSFFTRPQTFTAITVYMTIVGIIYNVILRFIWSPEGWDRVADEMLHVLMPILTLIFWFTFVPKLSITWKHITPWLIFPLLYLVYSLVRGSFYNWYPYPFLNVKTLGFSQVLINSAGVTAVFIVVSVIFVGIAKWQQRNKNV